MVCYGRNKGRKANKSFHERILVHSVFKGINGRGHQRENAFVLYILLFNLCSLVRKERSKNILKFEGIIFIFH